MVNNLQRAQLIGLVALFSVITPASWADEVITGLPDLTKHSLSAGMACTNSGSPIPFKFVVLYKSRTNEMYSRVCTDNLERPNLRAWQCLEVESTDAKKIATKYGDGFKVRIDRKSLETSWQRYYGDWYAMDCVLTNGAVELAAKIIREKRAAASQNQI